MTAKTVFWLVVTVTHWNDTEGPQLMKCADLCEENRPDPSGQQYKS